jgi:indole-3-glycerol phosphate synthase
VHRLHRAGYHAFLVGEHLIRSDNPEQAVRRLIGQHARFG